MLTVNLCSQRSLLNVRERSAAGILAHELPEAFPLHPGAWVQKPLKDVSKVCHAIIEASEKGEDIAKAIERAIQWPAFTLSVDAVDTLIAPDIIDGKIDMLQHHPTIRKLAPRFLSTLVFRGHAVAGNLLRALSVIADLYRTGKRTIPDKAPISFAPKGWMPLIVQDVSPGITMRQLAWAHDWHIREEGYTAAHALLVNAQRQLPLANLWGDGTTSSSDGQYFPAGGHAEAIGDLNARYGPNPGSKFYRFRSDQYGAFYIVAMNANASEAIYVLDGLLYHGSDLAIENNYVDTGGVSDMSFALCHLVGFQLVPRLRGLKDRKLYLFPGDVPPENLAPLVGEPVNVDRIKVNWNDILRLVTTIRSGQVRPSTLLAKLSAFPRQNGLALALRDLGRINRSVFLPSGGRTRRCAETQLPASIRAKLRTPWRERCSSTVSESCATGLSRVSSTGHPG